MVMEKLLEKLRCRTISVANGSEAVRYSMSEIKFDVIFLEYKLPQINGADVARMIRETKNANSQTPIVAITAYLKELQAPHYFDSLIEKPISSSKLTEVLRSLCHWRPESPGSNLAPVVPALHATPSLLRKITGRPDDSPTSSSSMFLGRQGSSVLSSREDSISSSVFGDSESVTTDDIPVVISRKATNEWDESGLGISEGDILSASEGSPARLPPLTTQRSAPPQIEHPSRPTDVPGKSNKPPLERRRTDSTESADDEDDELGLGREKHVRSGSKAHAGKSSLPSSKLGIEMMRANSHDSVTVGSESTPELVTQVVTTPSKEEGTPVLEAAAAIAAHTPPPDGSKTVPAAGDVEETPRPAATAQMGEADIAGVDDDATPRAAK
jgi:serine/threonine-protein kinase RIM15